MTEQEEARRMRAWEIAQLIYWHVEHPNPREAEALLDDWIKIAKEYEVKIENANEE